MTKKGNLYDEVEKLFKSGINTGFEGIEHSAYKTAQTSRVTVSVRESLQDR